MPNEGNTNPNTPTPEQIEAEALRLQNGGGGDGSQPPPSAPRSTLADDIRKFNEGIEPDDDADDDLDTDDADDDADDTADDDAGEGEGKEPDKKEENEKKEPDAGKKDDKPADDDALTFDESLDWETLETNVKKLTEKYDLSEAPEVVAALDTVAKKSAEVRVVLDELEKAGGKDTVLSMVSAANKMFDVNVVDGKAVPNTEPFVNHLRKDYANEYSALARHILGSDSMKYKGASMMMETLIDEGVSAAKVSRIAQYIASDDAELPAPAKATPDGIPAETKDAWADLDEVKRFEIEGMLNSVAEMKERLDEAEEWMKSGIEKSIGETQAKINGEIKSLQKIQFAINTERSTTEAAARTAQEANAKFANELQILAKQADVETAEEFVAAIAPTLDFVEEDARTLMARNIMSTVANAVSFSYDLNAKGDLEFYDDPFADYYVKQLKDEKITFDFDAARDLLKQRVKVQHKLQLLEKQGGSPAALRTAQHELKSANINIKAELKDLTGQITRRYVKSAGEKLKKDVDEKQKIKLGARPRIGGDPAPRAPKSKDDRASISRDLRKHNRDVERAIADGDLDGVKSAFGG